MTPQIRTTSNLTWCLRAFAALATAVSISVLGVFLLFLHQTVRTPVNQDERFFVVAPGTGAIELAEQLVSQGLTGSQWSVIAWSILSGTAGSFKSGEYLILPHTSPAQILGMISRGDVHQRRVTLIEGLRFSQLREHLAKNKKLKVNAGEMSEDELLVELSLNPATLEGRFFPSTYFFVLGDTDTSILRRAAQKMDQELTDAWERRDPDLPLNEPYQALILASVIQKEAMLASEMPHISGVFHNRLRLKMRLQTDPTVIFGLGPDFKGPLKRSDLKKDTPYNTYTRGGLPPGPIALPGRAALLAAINPVATEDLYFVAKGDGSHQFSKTLTEHNRAVKKYRN